MLKNMGIFNYFKAFATTSLRTVRFVGGENDKKERWGKGEPTLKQIEIFDEAKLCIKHEKRINS